ncbi:T9SS type A sorting domain-containing protein [Persicobacter sp. CCB-QB2]|uniref:T9SS type A sorting domain-containing protein n=1 Tax=Persicobacter sp. CCB-QB2 TaxID=1561025 RepID=UPI0006A9505C|nr:T9SS type A sorting domain-containing protein [Persicobacter sp. CCB-QB2]
MIQRISINLLFLLCSLPLWAQQTIDVYSSEIPWSEEEVTTDPDKIYSINEAIAMANAGDLILVHEGIYREKITVNKNNIEIRNHEDDYVLVSGNELVSGWTKANNMAAGIMEADISQYPIETDFTQLFAEGRAQMMARHPNNTTGDMMEPLDLNSGYALLSNVYKDAGANANGYATLEGTTLPKVDLTGGIFRGLTGKMRNYVYGNITASSGNSVTFKAINKGVWQNEGAIKNTQHKFSWGFVMHKNLIDIPGEWFAEEGKLWYMPEADTDLENARIEIQVRERVLVLNNTTGVRIRGIHFIGGNVDMQKTTDAVIEGCSMRYLYPFWTPINYGQNETEKKGIYLSNSSNNLFKDTYIAHSWGNMVAMKEGQHNRFENCVIKDFGWIGVFTSAIYNVRSDNASVKECTFGDGGRFHIRVSGGDAKMDILDSDFYGAMKMGEDAGPIEATSTGSIGALDMKGSEIAYNKVRDTHGLPVSDGGYNKQKIVAFYMEDTENYTAHHNLIYNIRANNYKGGQPNQEYGEFLYLGPRYNAMRKPVHYYNNTVWDVDAGISIWNIEIDNWEALGIAPEDSTGMMTEGHFANNIFMQGADYKLSYVRQKLTPTGGNLGYVPLNPSPSFGTLDFDAFTNYCSDYGYQFNPEANHSFELEEASIHFTDASKGNFSLLSASPAKGQGVVLEGITSSEQPDCGAFEGGNRVMNAGAKISTPDFKEVKPKPEEPDVKPPLTVSPKTGELTIYPNPANNTLFFDNYPNEPKKIIIYSLSGKKIIQETITENKISVQKLPVGVYLIKIIKGSEVSVSRFVKQ